MVGHTRGSPEGFGREIGSGSQQPPPLPPNLAELMAMQIELLRQLVQGQQNPPRQQQRGGRDEQPAGYQEFFGTQPPLFSRTDEPLDADAWLRTIESKFALSLVWIQRQGTTKLGKNETITSSQPPQHQQQRKKKTPVSTV